MILAHLRNVFCKSRPETPVTFNMKRIVLMLFAAVLMTACAFSLAGQFTQLADKVAAKGADYTPEQWEKPMPNSRNSSRNM